MSTQETEQPTEPVLTRSMGIEPSRDSLSVCSICENQYRWEEMNGWLCHNCYTECTEECSECGMEDCECVPETDIEYATENLSTFQSSTKGKYITSPRIFSAEIECYYPNGAALRALNELPSGIGVSGDGSLNNRGIEIQTPKLKGAQGELQLKNICKLLSSHNYTVDKSTGMHIHLDGRGLLPRSKTEEPIALKQLWYFYSVFDTVLMSMLPHSRRINRFCASTRLITKSDTIEDIATLYQLERKWYNESSDRQINYRKKHKYDSSRYAGVNLHSLLSARHLEIRFHGGTTNYIKILEWTALHQRILDLAAKKQLPLSKSKKALVFSTFGEQTNLFFELLGLPERSVKYFVERQKLFERSNETEGETDANIEQN